MRAKERRRGTSGRGLGYALGLPAVAPMPAARIWV